MNPEQQFCPTCGKPNDMSDLTCQDCGSLLSNTITPPVPPPTPPTQPPESGEPVPSSPKPTKPVIPKWVGIVAVVVAGLVIAASILLFIPKIFPPIPNPLPTSTAVSTQLTTLCLATDLPTSGSAQGVGLDIQKGVELAFSQSPLSTRYQNHELKTSYMDNASRTDGRPDPKTGVKNIQNLLQQTNCPNPIAIIGPYDSPTAVLEIPLTAQNHILLLSPSNTAPCLTLKQYSDSETCDYDTIHAQDSSRTYYARLPGADTIQGNVIADFLWSSPNSNNPEQGGLGARKIAIIGDEEIFGTQISQIVIDTLKSKGAAQISIDCVKPATEFSRNRTCSLNSGTDAFSIDNIAALAAKIRDQKPDAIFFGGRPDRGAGPLRSELGKLGLDQIPFVGPSAFIANPDAFLGATDSHSGNVYAVFDAADPSTFKNGKAATFSQEYEKKFGKAPGAYSANGYDAAHIILEVIKTLIDNRQQVTRESVAQGVLSGTFTGVADNYIRFDSNGDNIGKRLYTIYQSQESQGKWSFKVLTQRAI
jgi:branched-chain amino acid transport system substrate-binding protein